jgi:PhzF family phenazine biosynthesis protein
MQDVRLWQADAFTNRPFGGNPAAIYLLNPPLTPTTTTSTTLPSDSGWPSNEWMQALATEMNLSETAFLLPRPAQTTPTEEVHFGLRWFTPAAEVELCGHATLASAHILWNEVGVDASKTIVFHTLRTCDLLVRKEKDGWITLDFPIEPPVRLPPEEIPAALFNALGLNGDQIEFVGKNKWDLLVEVPNEDIVQNLAPNFSVLAQVQTRCVIVTAKSSSSPYHFLSRVFGPKVGINEDPVTGSAHCALFPYWQAKLGKDEMLALQASKRGGILRLSPSREGKGVFISGEAVTVFKAVLNAHPS